MDSDSIGRTILIVEDAARIRMLVRAILAETGWTLLEASSAEEALAINARVDLLLTDLRLPGMNGLDLAQELRHTNPKLKILCMSGALLPPAASNNGIHFIEKPFPPQTLLDKARELLANA
jgi:DNA-binding NtrC family response regulator